MRTIIIQNREEIVEAIRSCKTCYLGMSLNDQPYVLPMNFALDGDSVILHSAMHGRMWDTLRANPNVSINWTSGEELAWQDQHVGCSYRVQSTSVVVEGVAQIVNDYDEKYRCMTQFMKQYSELPFKFNPPSIRNVGVIKVSIRTITGRRFGVRTKPGSGRSVQ
jgi:nitroimidazol reductase NimA-like FMN-containing flavoprotein (pyridoxamine 5'-phosphate oxidase superfamily)